MYNKGFEVSPRSRDAIRDVASKVRREIANFKGVDAPVFIDIVEYLDIILPQVDHGFCLDIRSRQEMGSNHGLTIPREKRICIREDVYEEACNGRGEHRMTLAHELGHYRLHDAIIFAKRWEGKSSSLPQYKNSEWQADCFGGELLMDYDHIRQCLNIREIMKECGVSFEAASYHFRLIKNEKG